MTGDLSTGLAEDGEREAARLRALRRYCVIDTPPERGVDQITAFLARLTTTPIALLGLRDEERLFVKSSVGVATGEAPWLRPLCDEVIRRREVLVVEDASSDPRFADLEGVATEPSVRHFAGAPLIGAEGHAIGALCIADREPRMLRETETGALVVLARQAMEMLEMRLQARVDPLSGLYDRRAMEERLQHERVRVLRGGSPLSLAVLDVQALREEEEQTGRVPRDRAVRVIGRRLRAALSLDEMACSPGYDEVAVVMPAVGADAGRARAMALRDSLAGADASSTIPAGLATWTEARGTVAELLSGARSALERSRAIPGVPVVIAAPE